ncbi:MAG: protein kinase [Anaerolineae bacterium]|nr:protein kinase [Anaerolineae bacterium]
MALPCPTCGRELPEGTKFCPNCGTNLAQAINDDATIVNQKAQSDDDATVVRSKPQTDDDEATIVAGHTPTSDDVTIVNQEGPTIVTGKAGSAADAATRVAEEEERTVAMPPVEAGEDNGLTRAMPEPDAADGLTRAMPDDPREAEGRTKAMPEEEGQQPSPGITATAVSDLKVGRILQERYRLDKILGKGGFGAAYLAEDVKLKRVCVVKQMLAPEGASTEDLDLHRANFEREASLLVQLNHPGHPNIPEIYDYFSDAGSNYLVMKYIEGQNLKDVLGKGEGKIPWREAVRYVTAVCSALNYMHTQGDEPVMHRDIKPANILLGDDGRVWLVDFGLAKAKPVESSGDLMATQAAGSLGYTPLEQWLGEAVPASDVYALGATLHHLVTGQNPVKAFGGEFNVEKLKETHGQFTPVRKIDKGLPKQLEQIITRTTDPTPEQRLTPLQLQKELEALISGAQAAALYTFKNGESAKTVKELVILCEQNRPEAQQYLYNGDFERWFLLINRNDLAEAATQAVKQGKNQKDGLERFLKLILPNLFLNRLGRASGRLVRGAVVLVFILIVFVVLLIIGGSYGAGWFLRQSINSAAWDFDHLNLDDENRITEADINQGAQGLTRAYFDKFSVDMRPPDQIDVNAGWGSIQFTLLVMVNLENGQPHFYLAGVNDVPLYLIGDNISRGINNGIDDVFNKAPVDIARLTVDDTEVTFLVEPSGRAPLPTPTPTITPTPTPAPTPTVTPTPVGMALVAVFNELDKDIIVEIDGETWEIAAAGSIVFEKKPGSYDFVVTYKDTGLIAAEGTKQWTVSSYKWRIREGE